jgi:hypothetical protein
MMRRFGIEAEKEIAKNRVHARQRSGFAREVDSGIRKNARCGILGFLLMKHPLFWQ